MFDHVQACHVFEWELYVNIFIGKRCLHFKENYSIQVRNPIGLMKNVRLFHKVCYLGLVLSSSCLSWLLLAFSMQMFCYTMHTQNQRSELELGCS